MWNGVLSKKKKKKLSRTEDVFRELETKYVDGLNHLFDLTRANETEFIKFEEDTTMTSQSTGLL